MREFVTAVNADLGAPVEDGDDPKLKPITTKLDGRKLVLQPMTAGQMALAMYAISNGRMVEQIGSIVNIFFGMLAEDSEIQHYKARLWDRTDPFEPEVMVDIIREAIAEWSGKDTPLPTA